MDEHTLDHIVDAVASRGMHALDDVIAELAVGGDGVTSDQILDRYQARMDHAVFQPLLAAAAHDRALPRFMDDVAKWVLADGRHGCLVLNEGALADDPDDARAVRARHWRQHIHTTLNEALLLHGAEPAEARQRADLLVACVAGLNAIIQSGAGLDEIMPPFEAVQAMTADWA